MTNKSKFKKNNKFELRLAEASKVRERFPDRIPVIVEKSGKSNVPDLPNQKLLVPDYLTVGQFVSVLRGRIKVSAEIAIFVLVDNVLPPTGAALSTVYQQHKDADGFLYVTYCGENTFGN